MPWTARDATRHTKKSKKSATARRQWSKVANSILARTHDEGRAVRGANAAVAKRGKKRKRTSGSRRG